MASTTLNEVVLELQEQNRTLDDVKEGIKAMLTEDIMARKKEERSAGDRREAELEANRKKTSSDRPNVAPRSFTSGLSQGLGLDGILQGVSSFGGILGGASIGGLIGTALGRLFLPAAGAILGGDYLDKWIDPLVDKITGDDATWTMFGQEIDASKIVSGFAGALGVIFAKEALTSGMKKIFAGPTGVGYRKGFIRRLGLGGVILAVGTALSSYITDITNTEKLGDVMSNSASMAAFGYMLAGPKGAIILGLATLGTYAAQALGDWLTNKRKEAEDKLNAALADADARFELATTNRNIIEMENAYSDAQPAVVRKRQLDMPGASEDASKLSEMANKIYEIDPSFAAAERLRAARMNELKTINSYTQKEEKINTAKVAIQELIDDRLNRGRPIDFDKAVIEIVGSNPTLMAAYGRGEFDDLKIDYSMFNQTFKRGLDRTEMDKSRRKFRDTGQIITGITSDKSGALKSMSESYAERYAHTPSITIGTVDNSTNVVGGGKGSGNTSTDLGSSIDYYHLEKRLVGGTAMYANGTFNVRKY